MAVLGSTNLTGCNSIPDFIATGSLKLFQQTTAPTSWTKQTTHNDKALRVVSGSASSGGTFGFSAVFAERTPTGTVGSTTLTEAQMPSHLHTIVDMAPVDGREPQGNPEAHYRTSSGNVNTDSKGSSNSHNHSFSGSALSFTVQYVDLIICSKN